MKKMFAIALMAISVPAMAGRVEVRKDTMRLMECSVYHQSVYPLYTMSYVNSGGLLYDMHNMGTINLETPIWSQHINASAKKFGRMTVDQRGAALMRCQVFLSTLIIEHGLIEHAKKVSAASKKQ